MAGKMTYDGVGVNYDAMDLTKRISQIDGCDTSNNIYHFSNGDFKEARWSRGESAYLMEVDDCYWGGTIEGLGTKNLVADAMYRLTGKSYYDHIAQCNVAMVVNDLVASGVFPHVFMIFVAAGKSSWFTDEKRYRDFSRGTKNACNLARCTWGCGETQTVKDMVMPKTVILAGAAVGRVKSKKNVINPANIKHGDAIVMIESSGIHANGLTMAREIGERKHRFWKAVVNFFLIPNWFPPRVLSDGYLTKLDDGRTYGETLLDPTHIYVGLVEDCISSGVDIHYAVNITGHGWRKLMRATQPFAYIIDRLPKQQLIFDVMQRYGPVDDREAYGNWNMGAGFALYVSEADVDHVIRIATTNKLVAFRAGHIEQSNSKSVIIKPKGLEYLGSTLRVR